VLLRLLTAVFLPLTGDRCAPLLSSTRIDRQPVFSDKEARLIAGLFSSPSVLSSTF